MKYGVQLYSLRDVTGVDFDNALAQVAKMGYSLVESAGFFGHSAQEVKEILDKHGLVLCSTHTKFAEIDADIDSVIEFHRAVGCKDIIIPGAPQSTKADVDHLVDVINAAQPKVEAAGMRLHFHNHSKEFMPNDDGLYVEEELAKRTKVFFELDTFWIFNAGLDPLEIIDKYADRVLFVHVKDGIPQDFSNPESRPVGKSLGSGKAPVEAVRAKAIDMGLTMVVESEGLDPTGPEEVQRCIEYLKELDAKG